MHQQLFDHFATLLSYPQSDYRNEMSAFSDTLTQLQRSEVAQPEHDSAGLGSALTEMARLFDTFAGHIAAMSDTEIEELFTRTFDMNPPCCLETGWHLYGETYDRGAFLVQMRTQLRRFAIVESSELPDHLRHVLQVLSQLPEQEVEVLAVQVVAPTLEKILTGFGEERKNPYIAVLQSLQVLITFLYPVEKEVLA
ncbi:MAG: molecular chaperone TorD family protein [Bacteroidota bacterium]